MASTQIKRMPLIALHYVKSTKRQEAHKPLTKITQKQAFPHLILWLRSTFKILGNPLASDVPSYRQLLYALH